VSSARAWLAVALALGAWACGGGTGGGEPRRPAERDVQSWVRLLRSGDVYERRQAGAALAAAGPAAVGPLGALLRDPHPAVREQATRALARIGPEARPDLERALLDSNGAVRRAAADGLSHGPARSLAGFDQALHAPHHRVREDALAALPAFGAAALPRLQAVASEDPDVRVRRAAVEALGRLGEAARPALAALARSEAAGVRAAARRELRRLGAGKRDGRGDG